MLAIRLTTGSHKGDLGRPMVCLFNNTIADSSWNDSILFCLVVQKLKKWNCTIIAQCLSKFQRVQKIQRHHKSLYKSIISEIIFLSSVIHSTILRACVSIKQFQSSSAYSSQTFRKNFSCLANTRQIWTKRVAMYPRSGGWSSETIREPRPRWGFVNAVLTVLERVYVLMATISICIAE